VGEWPSYLAEQTVLLLSGEASHFECVGAWCRVFEQVIASVGGPAAAGRPLCKCPPASACGRPLLLYFARDLPAATGLGLRLAGKSGRHGATPVDRAPGRHALGGEVKEEVSAAGRRRGTFAGKGVAPRRSIHRQPRLLQRALPLFEWLGSLVQGLRTGHRERGGPRRGRQAPVQMSPGGGLRPPPPPLLCQGPTGRDGARLAVGREKRTSRGNAGGSSAGAPCPWRRSKGGGVGRRPTPGDIRRKGYGAPALDPPAAASAAARASLVRVAWKLGAGSSNRSSRAWGAPPRPAGPCANVPRRRPAAAPSSFTLPGTYRPRRGSACGWQWKSGSQANAGGASAGPPCPCGEVKEEGAAAGRRRGTFAGKGMAAPRSLRRQPRLLQRAIQKKTPRHCRGVF